MPTRKRMAMTRANAKYNIGGVYRTINMPLQTLELLHPQYRTSIRVHAWRAGSECGVRRPRLSRSESACSITHQRRVWRRSACARPRVDRTRERDQSSGPSSGIVAAYLKEMLVRVEYQRDSRLQMFVPVEMEEDYGLDIEVVHGRAKLPELSKDSRPLGGWINRIQ